MDITLSQVGGIMEEMKGVESKQKDKMERKEFRWESLYWESLWVTLLRATLLSLYYAEAMISSMVTTNQLVNKTLY